MRGLARRREGCPGYRRTVVRKDDLRSAAVWLRRGLEQASPGMIAREGGRLRR